MKNRFIAVAAVSTALGLSLAGCAGTPSPEASDTATLSVVASTNVYGDIAKDIGGNLINVTSIIDDPSKDPHEYEADAQNQLAFSKADIVIKNGGGYDDFVDTLLDSSKKAGAVVFDVADISGYDQMPAKGEFNEHLWYDFPTVTKLVDKVELALSDADPGNASTFKENSATLRKKLSDFEAQETKLKATYEGDGVAITEPVPLYMLKAAGLDNKTPAEFSEAIEEDTDVPADVLKKTLDLFSNKSVKLLAYNEQTTGPQTEAVLSAAKDNSIAVVPVRETLPEGKTYLQWMQGDLDAISAALGG